MKKKKTEIAFDRNVKLYLMIEPCVWCATVGIQFALTCKQTEHSCTYQCEPLRSNSKFISSCQTIFKQILQKKLHVSIHIRQTYQHIQQYLSCVRKNMKKRTNKQTNKRQEFCISLAPLVRKKTTLIVSKFRSDKHDWPLPKLRNSVTHSHTFNG